MSFNHKEAQKYELESHINWLKQGTNYKDILDDIHDSRKWNKVKPHYLDQFFKGDLNTFFKFYDRVRYKANLEVAGGICGVLPLWANWLEGRKISIDPLLGECDEWLKSQGESWFDGIKLLSICAEDKLRILEDQIDGFILWRNGLDHMAEPEEGIKVISSYAVPGCELYFWSDVKHKDKPDVGHKNIGETPEDVQKMIEKYGWKLLYKTPDIHQHLGMIEFGGVFVKE